MPVMTKYLEKKIDLETIYIVTTFLKWEVLVHDFILSFDDMLNTDIVMINETCWKLTVDLNVELLL